MNKRQLAKELKKIVTGEHGHEAAAVYAEGRSWKIETGFQGTCRQIAQENYGLFFHHDRNSATIAEVQAEFEYAWENYRMMPFWGVV